MSKSSKTILIIIILIAIIAIIWTYIPKSVGYHGGTQVNITSLENNYVASTTDTSDSAINQDMSNLDSQLNDLNSDESNVDASLASSSNQ